MEPELLDSLKQHIQSHLKKGYKLEEIENSLAAAGFDRSSINKAFEELNVKKPGLLEKVFAPAAKKPVRIEKPEPIITKPKESWLKRLFRPKPRAPKKALPKHAPKSKVPAYVTLFSILIIIVLIAATLTILFYPAKCRTKECFIEKANACEKATYQNVIAGATINYESRSDCTLLKTITSVADTEPAEIKEKFEGKSMMCTYNKNNFSPLHVETISGLIVNCEGQLRQELIQYVI